MAALRENAEVLARLRPFGILMEKSLSDLIKGIRSHLLQESPESLVTFLESCVLECKRELSTTDLETKSMAILKLTYLEMYGFDMSWSNFHILEVMASPKFQHKRIGYLAAIQSFKNEQELLILATNQFKKDLGSHQHIEIGLALSGIATIVTPVLAKDISDDVVKQLNHSKPYVRKKAILAMYKIFLQYPESLRINFDRITERLEDTDVSVVSATINVICEVSTKNPQIFLNSIPRFFQILQDLENNWLTIKVLKLFQSLSRVEPRLKKKILPFLLDFLDSTKAISLMHETIMCIVNGEMLSSSKTAEVCVHHLIEFFFMKDPNLSFVGLLVLIKILKKYPNFINDDKRIPGVIMSCLGTRDLIIKRKATEICHYLVNDERLVDLVKELLRQLIPSEGNGNDVPDYFKREVTMKIIEVASMDNYSYIPNFKWYIAVLEDLKLLTLLPPSEGKLSVPNVQIMSRETSNFIATQIGKEFKNLAIRVPSIRTAILKKIVFSAICDPKVISSCPSLLTDLFWILGEYIGDYQEGMDDDNDDEPQDTCLSIKLQVFNNIVSKNFKSSVSEQLISLDNPAVLIVLIQALVKLFNDIVSDYHALYHNNDVPKQVYDQIAFLLYKLVQFLSHWEKHSNYEVQERTLSWLEFLKLLLDALGNSQSSLQKMAKEEEEDFIQLMSEESEDADSEADFEDESDEDSDSSDEEDSDDSDEEDSDDSDKDVTNPEEDEEDEQKADDNNEVDMDLVSDDVADGKYALPVLLTHILPSFFKSYSLNPIAKGAQYQIPVPDDLDLNVELNAAPFVLLPDDASEANSDYNLFLSEEEADASSEALIDLESETVDKKQRKKDRLDRLKEDPYYITTSGKKTHKKKKNVLTNESKHETSTPAPAKKKKTPLKKEKVLIIAEESLGTPEPEVPKPDKKDTEKKPKKNVLRIDSSNLDNFDINSSNPSEIDTESKGYEYDIDLAEIRNKLAKASLKDKKTKKKTKKSKDKEGKSVVDKDMTKNKADGVSDVSPPEQGIEYPEESAVKEITKLKKKKKKAVIIE